MVKSQCAVDAEQQATGEVPQYHLHVLNVDPVSPGSTVFVNCRVLTKPSARVLRLVTQTSPGWQGPDRSWKRGGVRTVIVHRFDRVCNVCLWTSACWRFRGAPLQAHAFAVPDAGKWPHACARVQPQSPDPGERRPQQSPPLSVPACANAALQGAHANRSVTPRAVAVRRVPPSVAPATRCSISRSLPSTAPWLPKAKQPSGPGFPVP